MEIFRAEVLINEKHILAEGPVWDEQEQILHYVDIKSNMVFAYDPVTGGKHGLDTNQNTGCFALRQGGGYILGLASGVYLSSSSGDLERYTDLLFDPMTRANDGKCDLYGNFWCGTADLKDGAKKGRLYRFSPDGTVREVMDKLECSNGMAFRGDRMWYIDSMRHRVDSYHVDPETGALSDHRVVAEIRIPGIVPDGMTIDADGMIWVAHWGGGFVGRYHPETGELLARVEVPASQSSSCCFGGKDLQTLYVTTASVGKPNEPEAGKVFAVRLPYQGCMMNRYPG